MSATMEGALTEAILWLKKEPQDSDLVEIMFGKYSDKSGFFWLLRFSRTVSNGEVRKNRQDDEQRITMIVKAWSEQSAIQREKNKDVQV